MDSVEEASRALGVDLIADRMYVLIIPVTDPSNEQRFYYYFDGSSLFYVSTGMHVLTQAEFTTLTAYLSDHPKSRFRLLHPMREVDEWGVAISLT